MNYSKIILGGRLGVDPELREFNDKKVVNFSLAVNRKFSKNEPTVDWFRCEAWNGLAETISKFFKKGSNILITGTPLIDIYETGNGKASSFKVRIEDFSFVDSSTSSNSGDQPTTAFTPSEDDDMPF